MKCTLDDPKKGKQMKKVFESIARWLRSVEIALEARIKKHEAEADRLRSVKMQGREDRRR